MSQVCPALKPLRGCCYVADDCTYLRNAPQRPATAPLSPERAPLVSDSHPTDDEATEGAERSET